jgi:hypothetical protein
MDKKRKAQDKLKRRMERKQKNETDQGQQPEDQHDPFDVDPEPLAP